MPPPVIDYYYLATSPWTYLGASRFEEIARRHRVRVNLRPVDFHGRLFPAAGGLPLAERPPQRQAYRLVELDRWRRHLGIPLHLHPRHFPADCTRAHLMLVTAREAGLPPLAFAHAILRAVWADEHDIASDSVLVALANGVGLDGETLIERSREPVIERTYRQDTEKAVALSIFGAPTYVHGNELFWGQDRLDFLDRALARGYTPPDDWAGAWSI